MPDDWVALEALRGDGTAQEIADRHKTRPTQVTTWKRQASDGLTVLFSDKVRKAEDNEVKVRELHAKIGKLAAKNDFLSQGLKPLPGNACLHASAGMSGPTQRLINERLTTHSLTRYR